MAEAAGVVNRTGPSNEFAFREAISASPEQIQQLAASVRDLIFEVLPETVEVVWPRQRSVGWGIGPKKFTEQFAYLMPVKGHVTLGFYHGGDLPDPDGLLPTSGDEQVSGTLSMRSLKLSRPEDVARPALRSLIEAAVRHQNSLVASAAQPPD